MNFLHAGDLAGGVLDQDGLGEAIGNTVIDVVREYAAVVGLGFLELTDPPAAKVSDHREDSFILRIGIEQLGCQWPLDHVFHLTALFEQLVTTRIQQIERLAQLGFHQNVVAHVLAITGHAVGEGDRKDQGLQSFLCLGEE